MGPYPITVRFSGRRIDVKGRLSPGDRFVQDETIEEVVPGSCGTQRIAHMTGLGRAIDTILRARRLPAEETRFWGLLTLILPLPLLRPL